MSIVQSQTKQPFDWYVIGGITFFPVREINVIFNSFITELKLALLKIAWSKYERAPTHHDEDGRKGEQTGKTVIILRIARIYASRNQFDFFYCIVIIV